jgi:FdrA protein
MPHQALGSRIFKNTYRDSVELMRIAAELERLPGVERTGAMMATAANLELLAGAGLLREPLPAPAPNDLVVSVAAADEAAAGAALVRAAELLAPPSPEPPEAGVAAPATLQEGLAALPRANLAIISTPGAYATAEALRALSRGLHVFLFSSNVPLEDEIELKRLAAARRLLMMGPDCGTAIIDGVPLGFANVVRRGRIGVAGASGTGMQQVTCLIDRFGEGVSQAIGVGSRDLDERVGGVMMLAALDRLAADPETGVIVLVSKPPAPTVAARVLGAAARSGKPVVAAFLGGAGGDGGGGVTCAATFEEAAARAVALAKGRASASRRAAEGAAPGRGRREGRAAGEGSPTRPFAPGQDAIRGLFCGGSLAGEAAVVLNAALGAGAQTRAVLLDLGAEDLTAGRPHPMIDPRSRNEKIVEAAADPRLAVLLLDVVLGVNAHPDPAGALAPAVEEARSISGRAGRRLEVVASVCGTRADPQGLSRQERRLAAAGVLVAETNAGAARLAARLAGG